MEIIRIKASLCDANTGQIDGLPANPRQWTSAEVDALATSIKETPELFEARPLLVYAVGSRYIVLGGNLRLCASKRLKMRDVPAIVFPYATPIAKLREIVIKDNGAFGNWDYDMLANEWDDLPLPNWGVPAWESLTDEGEKDPVTDDKGNEPTITITFANDADLERFMACYADVIADDYKATITKR